MKPRKAGFGQAGITLVELIVAVAIVGVLLATAVPSFRDSIASNRARGAADGLYADMHFAKAEAIKRSIPVKIAVTAGPPWSYCVTTADCASGVLKNAAEGDFPGTTLSSTRTLPLSISINPLRGTTGQATTLTFKNGSASAAVVISSMGRIRRQ